MRKHDDDIVDLAVVSTGRSLRRYVLFSRGIRRDVYNGAAK